MDQLPVIDVGPLVAGTGHQAVGPGEAEVAAQVDAACRRHGFFVITGHGVDPALLADLDAQARAFFARPEGDKAAIAMERGGRAWRGWFPEGGELTAGRPDRKEGLYLGVDLPADDPRVAAGVPLHGPNLWPDQPAGLRPAVEAWMAAMAGLGHALVRGLGLALGLAPGWFDAHLTGDPTVLFRIFRYPASPGGPPPGEGWGVAEHTDYGLVTILAHDGTPGLEVRTDGGWLAVEAPPGSFVVNLGDMLERMTGGRYRSTPHRVRPPAGGRDRLSFPFFFDPAWDAEVRPIPGAAVAVAPDPAPPDRWDGASVHDWSGTYGDYLQAKVARVFPALGDAVLDGPGPPDGQPQV